MKASGSRSAKKPKRKSNLSTLAALLVVVIIFAFVVYSLIAPQQTEPQTSLMKAAIVDQLSMLDPNREFTKPAEDIMRQASLNVDVYGPENVTVGLYATLSAEGYGLIVFRVHGGVNQQIASHPVGLYTSEPYNEFSYPQEQLADLVGMGRAYDRNDTVLFAVTPKFIRERTVTDYPGTVVVLMGCYGLFSTELPQAFIDRGASVVIGWKGLVGLEHTDEATLVLLRALLLDKLSISSCVQATMNRVGPDPQSKSVLDFYPQDSGSLGFSEASLKRGFEIMSIHTPSVPMWTQTWEFVDTMSTGNWMPETAF